MTESTTAYKGGVSGGVAVVVGALSLVVGGLVLVALLQPGRGTAVSVQVGAGPQIAFGSGGSGAGPVNDQPLVAPAPTEETPALTGDDGADDSAMTGPGGLAGLAMASAMAGGAAIASNTDVLIVNEFSVPLDPRVRDAVGRLENELRSEGMRVLGNTLSPLDPDRQGIEVNLLAEVHRVREQRSLDSRTTIADISDWIGRTDGVDYIIWIHPDETDATKPVLDPIAFVSKTGSSAMFIQAMRKALVDTIVQSVKIE